MTSVPPESIISSVDYAVRAVNGRPPQRDGDFDGEISLSLVYSSGGSAIHKGMVIRVLDPVDAPKTEPEVQQRPTEQRNGRYGGRSDGAEP